MKKSNQRNSRATLFAATVICISLTILAFAGCAKKQVEATEKWVSLFNGKDLEGWTPKFAGYELGDNALNTFRVEDDVFKVSYDEHEKFNNLFGHIYYKDSFSHYRLRLEYRFVGEQVPEGPGWAFRNNGIMVHCQDPKSLSLEQGFPVSIEVQLLGGNGEDERTTGNLCTPGTNVVLNGQLEMTHCLNSTSPTFHGDQWVKAEVEVHGGGIIRHFINGELVMEYEKPQYDERDKDAQKLIKDGNLELAEGFISFQAESHPTEFRNIEILVLDE